MHHGAIEVTIMSISFMSKRAFLGEYYYSPSDEIIPDEVRFFAEAALSLLGPTLALCVVISHLWPLYVITCTHSLGALLGYLRFHTPSDPPNRGVPVTRVPNIARVARQPRLNRAA